MRYLRTVLHVTYAITSFGAWSVVIALEKPDGRGLDMRISPVLAGANQPCGGDDHFHAS